MIIIIITFWGFLMLKHNDIIDISPYLASETGHRFQKRHATMPWRSSLPVDSSEVASSWLQLLNTPQAQAAPQKRLVYVHIPFCETHCTFCGFYQNKFTDSLSEHYVEALINEITFEAENPLYSSAPIHAIYFGGGTPTALSATQLFRIITTLRQALPVTPDCEITIEGRVLNFSQDKVDSCIDAGANRFSVGIQTFDSKIRKRLARTSTGEEAQTFMQSVVARDQAAVVCDLLFGLPNQTIESWHRDLQIIQDIGLDGVDLYALNVLPSTALGKAVTNGRVQIPSHEQSKAFYLQGCDVLDKAGWQMISNSHFARTTRERNLYNLLIKQGADCLAFGSGAGGSINGYSYMLQRNLTQYIEAVSQGEKPIMMMTKSLGKQSFWHHQLQAGIEQGRIDLGEITPFAEKLTPLLSQWQQCNIIQSDSTLVRLTNEGRFWASHLLTSLQEIIPKLTAHSVLQRHSIDILNVTECDTAV